MSMYGRVVVPYILALVTGALMAWWLVTSLLADSLTQRLEDQLERAVAELAAGRLPLSEDLLDRVGHLLGAELALVPAAPYADSKAPSPLTTAALQVLDERPDGGASRIPRSGVPYSLVVRPIQAGVDPRYRALAAGTALTEVQQSSRRIAALLGAGVLAGTLVLAWAGHRAARAITVPITTLSGLAERLATGDLRARVPVTGAPELVALGTSIERMADHLADYQTRLLEANRLSALGELAARVAHEIRNPLTAIKLHAELLREAAQDAAERKSLDAILGEIQRLELIVSSTLNLGRSPSATPAPSDLNELVRSVLTLLEPQLAHRRIRLECRLTPLPRATLDAGRIKQVLLNLLNNAAEELPGGGTVRISTGRDPGRGDLYLAVEDSGPGLPPDQTSDRPPEYTGPGRSGKPHGLGLGLQISREIAAHHGGSLRIESSPDLGGARLVLSLPWVDPDDAPARRLTPG